ncbi:hypothetical protein IMZ48_23810 [Candidatus Bathyarchaeota archaeon]|nr:hypothetical protein [Candidatus Bathyarchaeota archaeon]
MAAFQRDPPAGAALAQSSMDEKLGMKADEEKRPGADNTIVPEQPSETRIEEEDFQQDGVKRIRAITSAWSYKALVLTYILYVTNCDDRNPLRMY